MPDTDSLIKRIEATLDRATLRSIFRSKPPAYSPQGFAYATFHRRMLASTLDAFVIMLAMTPFNGLVMGYAYSFVQVDPQAVQAAIDAAATPEAAQQAVFLLQVQGGLLTALGVLLSIQGAVLAVYSYACWHFYSSTPGKLVLGMRIVDEKSGARITASQSVLRIVGYGISSLALLFGFFAIGWHPRKQGWHDRLARTVVVIDRPLIKSRSAREAGRPSDSPAPGESE